MVEQLELDFFPFSQFDENLMDTTLTNHKLQDYELTPSIRLHSTRY